ncbi:MAG: hypothetical protein J5829_09145 [Lachnospiraceae bacterium]|nr:hypothetical protein [Lachnospiraceae bacterium]
MNTQQVQRPVDMINNVHLGTWMEWKDIVSLFPNRWVFLTDYKLDDKSNIVGGILKVVCKETEFSLVEDILTEKNRDGFLHRTTELPGNILWVE